MKEGVVRRTRGWFRVYASGKATFKEMIHNFGVQFSRLSREVKAHEVGPEALCVATRADP